MPTDFAFRFSTYLTLLLACVCTGYAEWDYLPEVSFFTGVVAILMLVAFWADHRGQQLSLLSANILGAAIFLVATFWASYHYRRSESLMNTLPWPAGGLPYLSALMMLLVPAKLFRPKHVGDWWALQGLGISMVGVAGAMTDDAGFVLLLAMYMLAGIWSLTIFYIHRSAGHIPPPPPFTTVSGFRAILSPQTYLPRWLFVARSRPTVAEPFVGVGQPTPKERLGRSHFTRAVGWLIVTALLALPIFLLTPRDHNRQWELFGSKMETGISSFGVDLARTGELKVSKAPAFTVIAKNLDGSPASLSEDQRFRVATYFHYFYPRGRWNRGVLPSPVFWTPSSDPTKSGQYIWPPQPDLRFPNLGGQATQLEFRLEKNSYGMPLADPLFHIPGEIAPAAYESGGLYHHADFVGDGTFRFQSSRSGSSNIRSYFQLIRHASPDEPAAYYQLDPRYMQERATHASLVEVPSKKISAYANTLLKRLMAEGKLSREVKERIVPTSLLPSVEDHLAVAKAIEQHLGTSGEFEYSLNLRIHDRTIDPIDDFILNTKTGHCEKFAAALTMLVRSLRIPARFVHGYRGCEYLEDGVYQVRQDHAHAWVEILVSETIPGSRERRWYWHALDATAVSLDGQTDSDTSRVSQSRQYINWLITGLNSETQQQIVQYLRTITVRYGPFVVAAAIVTLLSLLGRSYLKRRKQQVTRFVPPVIDSIPWYTDLMTNLRSHGFEWQLGQTPHEYSLGASAWLRDRGISTNLAEVPIRFSEALEEHRYAGLPLSEQRLAELREQQTLLAQSLASGGKVPV